jgi:hypothetical protein
MKRIIMLVSLVCWGQACGVQKLLLLMNRLTEDLEIIGGTKEGVVAQWGDSSIPWVDGVRFKHIELCTIFYALAHKIKFTLIGKPHLVSSLDRPENLAKLEDFEKRIEIVKSQVQQTAYWLRHAEHQVDLTNAEVVQHLRKEEENIQALKKELSHFIGLAASPMIKRKANV